MLNKVELISSILQSRNNSDISVLETSFIQKTIEDRRHAIGLESIDDYISFLNQEPVEVESLCRLLNNTFTEFFRDSLNFSFLEKYIIPELIKRKSNNGEIRIWSAGCSTGQEVYSLAILLHEQLSLNKSCRFRIFATDFDLNVLNIAKKGIYTKESIQNINLRRIERNFEKIDDNYVISKDIKASILFSEYNLLDKNLTTPPESIYGDFDIIMCSNVMIYYNQDERNFMISKFKKALANNGYLITGDAENTFIKGTTCLVSFNNMTSIYQKSKVR